MKSRMNVICLSLVLFISFVLSGCAEVYQPPKNGEAFASIRGGNFGGLFSWVHTRVDQIDNKSSGLQFFETGKNHLSPGLHTITAKIEFSRGIFSYPCVSFSDIRMNFQAGQDYTIRATIQGDKVLSWVENNQHLKVSPVVASSYTIKPQSPTIIVMNNH